MPASPRLRARRVLRGPATPLAPGGMRVLVCVTGDFGARLAPAAVASALARGLREGGLAAPEALEVRDPEHGRLAPSELARTLHGAYALLIAAPELSERSLAGSTAFVLASGARQAGVPCYAVCARSEISSFDARMLDLQLVLQAGSARALSVAARGLARLMLAAADPHPA